MYGGELIHSYLNDPGMNEISIYFPSDKVVLLIISPNFDNWPSKALEAL